MSNKERLLDNNERLLDIAEKLLKLTSGGTEPEPWEKGVNIKDLGPGYFYLDAKLEEGDAAAMGLPDKYGAEWVGMYVVIRGSEDIYHYEAYIRDWYNDYLWHATLQSEITWVQILTSEHPPTAEQVGALPLTGGTLTGDLRIEKSYPRVELKKPSTGRGVNLLATDSYVEFSNEVDGTNFRGIRIKPETEAVEDSVFIYQMLDGLLKKYNLYGEHNITKGTTDLEAGTSALKSGCIHLVYE